MKDTRKMKGAMSKEGYHYCEMHDIYFDEWLSCPACHLEYLLSQLEAIDNLRKQTKELCSKFNPNDRS